MRVIGIDPGTKTGMAIYDKKSRSLIDVWITDFWGAYGTILAAKEPIDKVIIEVPRCKKNWQGAGAAIDVGGIVREAKLLADGIEKLGIVVVRVHPQGKHDAAYVKKLTGWPKRTNEHTRDAIMLCWGY